MKILLVPIFILTSTFGMSQEKGEIELIDELSTIFNCENVMAHVDNLFMELHNRSGTHGLIVIRGKNSEILNMLEAEQLVRTTIEQRRFNSALVTIKRSNSSDPTKVQMYLVRKGKQESDLHLAESDLQLPADAKPFLISTEDDHICPPAPLAPISRELLESNPDGQIVSVVNAPTAAKRRANLKRAIKALSGYPRIRYRFILRNANYESNDYWFIGRKRSKKSILNWLRK